MFIIWIVKNLYMIRPFTRQFSLRIYVNKLYFKSSLDRFMGSRSCTYFLFSCMLMCFPWNFISAKEKPQNWVILLNFHLRNSFRYPQTSLWGSIDIGIYFELFHLLTKWMGVMPFIFQPSKRQIWWWDHLMT